MSEKRDYDSTVARIAGNIASGVVSANTALGGANYDAVEIASRSVMLAYEIVHWTRKLSPNPSTEGEER